ncbi:MAG: HEAT repeat domain-containing protein [Microbacteriaceae bacterium]|nr:HEAT repeat domain-containing protein [Microbacteriaceae bacterium]
MKNSASYPSSIPVDLPTDKRVAAAVGRYGEADVIERSIALLGGANVGDDFLLYVGGRHAQGVLDGAPALYWPEVWGARALLHVWNQSAVPAIIASLENQAWRVREMAAKVVAHRELHVAGKLVDLTTDETPRVRAAAAWALAAVGTTDSIEAIAKLLRDPEKDVRRAAQQARDALFGRVGRPARVENPAAETPEPDDQ